MSGPTRLSVRLPRLTPRRRDDPEPCPRWQPVELEGRGTTWAIDRPGPDGHAPTVVLLHGLAATGALNWDPVIDALTDRFRVIALDHRGHGNGIVPTESFTLEDCADDLAALLQARRVNRAVLVGYSMGGAIAQLTWRRHPELVAGLVLLATAARFETVPPSTVADQLAAEARRHRERLPPAWQAILHLHDATRALAGFDARPWLGSCTRPAAVLITTNDRTVPPRLQHELASTLPDVRVAEVAGGHLLPILDRRRTTGALLAAGEAIAAEAGLGLRWWEIPSRHLIRLARRVSIPLRGGRTPTISDHGRDR
ncbi:MAG: alpha/beta fold hydrolase [Acidimicrobiales bacterium]